MIRDGARPDDCAPVPRFLTLQKDAEPATSPEASERRVPPRYVHVMS
jgi:hypothetical protein